MTITVLIQSAPKPNTAFPPPHWCYTSDLARIQTRPRFYACTFYQQVWWRSNKPEDHWSYIAHLSAEDMLKSVVIEEKKFKHSPWAGTDNPLGPKFWCQQEGLITMVTCCKFKKNLFNLWLYTQLIMIYVYSRRSGADNPRGQHFDVNRNLLSLRSFATSLKKISLKSDFIQFFSWF